MSDHGDAAENYDRFQNTYSPMDGVENRKLPVKLVNHEAAQKFFSSSYNIPWIKNPVCYIEDRVINVVYDSLSLPNITNGKLDVVYIRKPNSFVKPIENFDISEGEIVTYFDYSKSLAERKVYGENSLNGTKYKDIYEFECNDTVAEELISLAVAFALENVESNRLNSKLNMRGLEA